MIGTTTASSRWMWLCADSTPPRLINRRTFPTRGFVAPLKRKGPVRRCSRTEGLLPGHRQRSPSPPQGTPSGLALFAKPQPSTPGTARQALRLPRRSTPGRTHHAGMPHTQTPRGARRTNRMQSHCMIIMQVAWRTREQACATHHGQHHAADSHGFVAACADAGDALAIRRIHR